MYIHEIHVVRWGLYVDGEDEDGNKLLHRDLGDGHLELAVESIDRFASSVKFSGRLVEGSTGPLDNGFVIQLEILGVDGNNLPTPFYKETVSEALCLHLEGRLKQAYFSYFSALDRQADHLTQNASSYSELSKSIDSMSLKNKFRLSLKMSIKSDNVERDILVCELVRLFGEHVKRRNDIAHSLDRTLVSESDIDELLFIFFASELMREHGVSDMTILASKLPT